MTPYAQRERSRFIALMLFALLLLSAGIGLRDPWPADEPRFNLVAKQMVESGEYLFPHRGDELYSDKPPMFMWMQATGYHLTGSWRIAFLLPSLLSGLLTLWLVYDLARRLYGRRTAWLAAATLLFTLHFTFQMRAAQIDGVLLGLVTLSAYGLLRHLLFGPDWRWFWFGAFMAGFGTITKGVGFLPLLMLIPYFAARQHWTGLYRPASAQGWRWWLAAPAFVLAVALWLVPMLLAVSQSNDPSYHAYAHDILFGQTADRYLEPTHHLEPWWYFGGVIATLWLPASFALLWALPAWFKRVRRGRRNGRWLLLAAWAALVVLFFSLSGGKRDVYIMPALPIFVLAIAPLIPALLRRRQVQWLLFAFAAVLALGLSAGSLWAIYGEPKFASAMRELRGLDPWHITLAMGLAGVLMLAWFRPRRGALALAGTLTCIWLIYGWWAYLVINDSRSARGVMHKAGEMIGAEAELGLLSWKEQNLLQADRPAKVFGFLRPRAEQELAAVEWLKAAPQTRWLLVQRANLEACFLADGAEVVGESNRRRWFLVNAADLRPQCLPHPEEAKKRHKVAWH